MKSDLEHLMETRDIDALLITGAAQHNPSMVYFTGVCHLTEADLILPRGGEPLLFHGSMERDEAAKTGLRTVNMAQYPLRERLVEAGGDLRLAEALRYRWALGQAGVTSGRVSVYGKNEIASVLGFLKELEALMPEIVFVGEGDDSVLRRAMATKDRTEIERIRRMGEITVEVVGRVADFLSSQRAREGVLVGSHGAPVTVGEVKRRIDVWLLERGAENTTGCIFAIGRDAGVPHSSGNLQDELQLGKTIVFDIFPSEMGGGYHYDFTRTWCLGHAPEGARSIYADVLAVYQQILGELEAGEPCRKYQLRTSELFQARGHATKEVDASAQQGYVHSLGHGLGLHIHESPVFGSSASERDRLDPGVVVTIEPGLYYPERGLGCRLEDTVWVTPDGEIETLVQYPLDLVLPVRGG